MKETEEIKEMKKRIKELEEEVKTLKEKIKKNRKTRKIVYFIQITCHKRDRENKFN